MSFEITTEDFGSMPNQAEGTLNGQAFYFRARHEAWSLRVAKTQEEMYSDSVRVVASGKDEKAGWWTNEEARAFLTNILINQSDAIKVNPKPHAQFEEWWLSIGMIQPPEILPKMLCFMAWKAALSDSDVTMKGGL